mgnify:FL=1
MHRRAIGALAVIAVAASACGGDSQQSEAADLFVELVEAEGIEVDRSCVEDVTGALSDDDAALSVEAGAPGSEAISPEAQAILEQAARCVDVGSYVDSIVGQFESDDTLDADCFRAELADAATIDDVNAQAVDAAIACSS